MKHNPISFSTSVEIRTFTAYFYSIFKLFNLVEVDTGVELLPIDKNIYF